MGAEIEVEPGTTALEAAKQAGQWVPTLCLDDRMAPFGACRVCLVEIEGARGPVASCTTVCREGMEITPRPSGPAGSRRTSCRWCSPSCRSTRRRTPSSPRWPTG